MPPTPAHMNKHVAMELQLWVNSAHDDLSEGEEDIIRQNWPAFTYVERSQCYKDGILSVSAYEKRAHDVYVKSDRPNQTLEQAFFEYGEKETVDGPNGERGTVRHQIARLPDSLYIHLQRYELSPNAAPGSCCMVSDVRDPIGCPMAIDFSRGGFANALTSDCVPKRYALVGVQVARHEPSKGPRYHEWWGYVRLSMRDDRWAVCDSPRMRKNYVDVAKVQQHLSCQGNEDGTFPLRLYYRTVDNRPSPILAQPADRTAAMPKPLLPPMPTDLIDWDAPRYVLKFPHDASPCLVPWCTDGQTPWTYDTSVYSVFHATLRCPVQGAFGSLFVNLVFNKDGARDHADKPNRHFGAHDDMYLYVFFETTFPDGDPEDAILKHDDLEGCWPMENGNFVLPSDPRMPRWVQEFDAGTNGGFSLPESMIEPVARSIADKRHRSFNPLCVAWERIREHIEAQTRELLSDSDFESLRSRVAQMMRTFQHPDVDRGQLVEDRRALLMPRTVAGLTAMCDALNAIVHDVTPDGQMAIRVTDQALRNLADLRNPNVTVWDTAKRFEYMMRIAYGLLDVAIHAPGDASGDASARAPLAASFGANLRDAFSGKQQQQKKKKKKKKKGKAKVSAVAMLAEVEAEEAAEQAAAVALQARWRGRCVRRALLPEPRRISQATLEAAQRYLTRYVGTYPPAMTQAVLELCATNPMVKEMMDQPCTFMRLPVENRDALSCAFGNARPAHVRARLASCSDDDPFLYTNTLQLFTAIYVFEKWTGVWRFKLELRRRRRTPAATEIQRYQRGHSARVQFNKAIKRVRAQRRLEQLEWEAGAPERERERLRRAAAERSRADARLAAMSKTTRADLTARPQHFKKRVDRTAVQPNADKEREHADFISPEHRAARKEANINRNLELKMAAEVRRETRARARLEAIAENRPPPPPSSSSSGVSLSNARAWHLPKDETFRRKNGDDASVISVATSSLPLPAPCPHALQRGAEKNVDRRWLQDALKNGDAEEQPGGRVKHHGKDAVIVTNTDATVTITTWPTKKQ